MVIEKPKTVLRVMLAFFIPVHFMKYYFVLCMSSDVALTVSSYQSYGAYM